MQHNKFYKKNPQQFIENYFNQSIFLLSHKFQILPSKKHAQRFYIMKIMR